MAGTHPLAPDMFEVAEAGGGAGADAAARAAAGKELDHVASGEGRGGWRGEEWAGRSGRESKGEGRRGGGACPPLPPGPHPHPTPTQPPAAAPEGMHGRIAPPGGEACPAVIHVPFDGVGEDITTNSVVCATYSLPPHRPHLVALLPGAVEEVREICLLSSQRMVEGEEA